MGETTTYKCWSIGWLMGPVLFLMYPQIWLHTQFSYLINILFIFGAYKKIHIYSFQLI